RVHSARIESQSTGLLLDERAGGVGIADSAGRGGLAHCAALPVWHDQCLAEGAWRRHRAGTNAAGDAPLAAFAPQSGLAPLPWTRRRRTGLRLTLTRP